MLYRPLIDGHQPQQPAEVGFDSVTTDGTVLAATDDPGLVLVAAYTFSIRMACETRARMSILVSDSITLSAIDQTAKGVRKRSSLDKGIQGAEGALLAHRGHPPQQLMVENGSFIEGDRLDIKRLVGWLVLCFPVMNQSVVFGPVRYHTPHVITLGAPHLVALIAE